MDHEYASTREAFDEQSQIFLDLVERCDDLSAPTELDGWDCAVLVGHVSTALEALVRWQGSADGIDAELNAATWWDAAAAASEMNDSFSRAYAAKRSHDQLRDLITEAARLARDAVTTTPADAALVLPGGVAWARFDHGVATRVFELTVHGIDLARAIGADISPSPTALALVGAILDERLDGDRPADLTDDLAWTLAATGRTDTDDERLPVVR